MPDNFLVYTKPEDFTNRKFRSTSLSYAAKYAFKNRYKVPIYSNPDRKVLVWRPSPTCDRHHRATAVGRCKKAAEQKQQRRTAIWGIDAEIPASLLTSATLQYLFQSNPVFFYPAQVMLDAGSPATAAFFPTIDLKEVYHAVVGMLLSWLATQFPTQYTLSSARFHQVQAISKLRQRLSQGQHNEETYLGVLCAMQTAALLGDRNALLSHKRGLNQLEHAMAGPLSDYCRSIKPRHDALVKEAIGQSKASSEHHEPHLRPITSSPVDARALWSALPLGPREAMADHDLFDTDILKLWAAYFSGIGSDYGTSLYSLMHELRKRVLQDDMSLDRRVRPPEAMAAALQLTRLRHTADYLYLSSKYYLLIMQDSPTFHTFRLQATDCIYRYQPRNIYDRNLLIHSTFLTCQSWRTGTVLHREGVKLMESLKRRFPDVMQDWAVIRQIMKEKYAHNDFVLNEWEHNWAQSSSVTAQ